MSVPNKPSWWDIPGQVNQTIDSVQSGAGIISKIIDELQGQGKKDPFSLEEFQKEVQRRQSEDYRLWYEIRRINQELLLAKSKAQEAEKKAAQALQKVESVFQTIGKISLDLATKTQEIATLKIDVKLLQAGLAALGKSIPFLIKSFILSWLISEGLNLIISLLTKTRGVDLSKILPLIQSAKDDARAAATIAVKAEGKAEKALGRADAALENIKHIEKTALAAMKRLEAFTKSEIKFLTNATKNALLRLQDRITNLDSFFNTQVKNINATIQKINTDLLKDIQKINTDLLQTIGAVKADLLTRIGKIQLDLNKLAIDAAKIAGQIAAILITIAGINALLGKLKGGGVSVVNNNYYTTNTTNISQVNDNLLLKKIDATTTANLAVSTGNSSLLGTVNTKLGAQIVNGLSGWMNRFTNWSVVGRVVDLMTLAATLHNATMLSSSIGQTLIQTIQNVVEFIGLKDSENNIYNVSDLIGNSINGFLALIVGAENLAGIKASWKKANRIYQATGNLFSSLLNMGDTMVNALNTISGQNAKIGNALRLWGVVGEKAFGWFNPTPNFNNPLLTKLNSLEETASLVEQVSQEPLNVKSAKEDLENTAKELADSLAQETDSKQGKEIPEAKKEKEKRDADKNESTGVDITDSIDKVEADD